MSTWLPDLEVLGTLAIVAGCLVTGLLILLVAITQHSTVNYMFRTLLPVSALCMALALFDGTNADVFNIGVLFTGYLVMEGACWMFYSDISQRYRISAFQTFGVGRGALALGTLASTLTTAPVSVATSTPLQSSQGVVVMLVVLCIGFAMLPTNKEMLKSLKRGAHCPALDFDEDFLVVPALIPDDPDRAKQLFPAQETHSPASPHEADAGPAKDDGDQATCHPSEKDEGRAVHRPSYEAKASGNEPDGKPSDPHHPVSSEAEAKARQGRFRRQCEMVADRYLLSRREAEVLFLLAKGRNAAFIQEKLFISEGTARTHMRHIYAKLNVHSQKELMDLVESEATE